jgi:hypothetical protein
MNRDQRTQVRRKSMQGVVLFALIADTIPISTSRLPAGLMGQAVVAHTVRPLMSTWARTFGGFR